MVKSCPKYIYNVKKKKTCLGVLEKKEIREKDNETSLQEKITPEIKTTMLSVYAMHTLHFDLLTNCSCLFANGCCEMCS